MIQLRHAGLYVVDLQRETDFFKYVFDMYPVCENIEMADELLDDLLKKKKTKIFITKLITEQGKQSGIDDMLELLQVKEPDCCRSRNANYDTIYFAGRIHLGFGIVDMEKTVAKILEKGGKQATEIHLMLNGNKCCFCQDPEGNWLELIERELG